MKVNSITTMSQQINSNIHHTSHFYRHNDRSSGLFYRHNDDVPTRHGGGGGCRLLRIDQTVPRRTAEPRCQPGAQRIDPRVLSTTPRSFSATLLRYRVPPSKRASMESDKLKEQYYSPPPKLGKWEGFKLFLWNSETGQFLGRTAGSWGECLISTPKIIVLILSLINSAIIAEI